MKFVGSETSSLKSELHVRKSTHLVIQEDVLLPTMRHSMLQSWCSRVHGILCKLGIATADIHVVETPKSDARYQGSKSIFWGHKGYCLFRYSYGVVNDSINTLTSRQHGKFKDCTKRRVGKH
jgi:hypothetical protein